MAEKWIPVEAALPKEEGDIVVLIGGRRYLGTVENHEPGACCIYIELFIRFELEYKIEYIDCKKRIIQSGKWVLPCAFKEPTHWIYTPKTTDSKIE